jgi:hypothetical protein
MMLAYCLEWLERTCWHKYCSLSVGNISMTSWHEASLQASLDHRTVFGHAIPLSVLTSRLLPMFNQSHLLRQTYPTALINTAYRLLWTDGDSLRKSGLRSGWDIDHSLDVNTTYSLASSNDYFLSLSQWTFCDLFDTTSYARADATSYDHMNMRSLFKPKILTALNAVYSLSSPYTTVWFITTYLLLSPRTTPCINRHQLPLDQLRVRPDFT